MDINYAKSIIENNRDLYFDKVADQFSETRKRYWPEKDDLIVYIVEGEKVLDAGCGNGRLYELLGKRTNYIGIDISPKMISIARQKYGNHFQTMDILKLEFKQGNFDSIWCIAAFHHIPSRKLRQVALNGFREALKPHGRVIITCWYMYQSRYLKILLKEAFCKTIGLSKLDFKDVFLEWKNGKVKRYYHAFTKKELEELVKNANFKIIESKHLKRNNKKTNILIVAEKI